jgi:hypothetical protein
MSERTPLNTPLDLVLHLGMGKTGTSSIQAFLNQNRKPLAETGILYPRTPGRTRHVRLTLAVQPDQALVKRRGWRRLGETDPEAFRKTFRRRLFSEINESGLSRVLFSDEALFGSPDDALRRLRRLTDQIAHHLRLVVYLRRQDDHLVSRYQQVVKVGETRRLSERVPQVDQHPRQGKSWASGQGSSTYDYYRRLRAWEQLLEPDEFVIRRFEPAFFVDRSIYQDFFDASGIDTRADALNQVESVNESLDAESVEFLRILNILRQEDEVAAVLPPGNRPLVVRLAAAFSGPTLTMPEPLLDEFMAQWADSNRRVAQGMLGDDSGQLFRTDRKTRNTTSEQYLDPSRLEHFLEVSGLPEELHAPLRRIAEREATTR